MTGDERIIKSWLSAKHEFSESFKSNDNLVRIVEILAQDFLARKERGDEQTLYDKAQQERIEHWKKYHDPRTPDVAQWGKDYHNKILGSDYDIDKTNDVNHEHPYEDSKPKCPMPLVAYVDEELRLFKNRLANLAEGRFHVSEGYIDDLQDQLDAMRNRIKDKYT